MVQDTVEWFGDFTPNVVVTVNPPSAPPPEPDPNTPLADVRWIVTDHLGTPRMIFDQSGSLANTSRHDYLPFGEELTGQIGGRTPQQGYTGDSTRQKFTQKERDIETGLDYFGARYYASTQGRFTSTDPIIIMADRLIDPQELNLYNYARNNPLRFTDPTGEDVNDSSLKDNDDYQKWKKAFLATEAGRAQWDKYNNDHSITITISMGQNAGGKEGAETTPTFDAAGKLTGASIVLGTDFAKNVPSGENYPISSSLTPSEQYGSPISREARAVTFLGHEFGHVEDAQRIGGKEWQRQNQLIEQARDGFNKQGQPYFNSREYQQVVSQLGGTPVSIGTQRENRAEAYTISVLRQYFAKGAGHGGMPKRVNQAIQNYQKAHPQ
jgi:RHS repeat-associated protein